MVLEKVLKSSTSTFQMYLTTSTSTFGGLNPFLLGSRDYYRNARMHVQRQGVNVLSLDLFRSPVSHWPQLGGG